MRYKNYGIVITGGGHGIGKAIIEEFVREGAKGCFIDMNEDYGKTLISDSVFFYHGDVSLEDDLNQFVLFCKEKLTRIDILINNACVSHQGILSQCSYQEFQKSLAIGVTAPYYLSMQF